MDRVTVRMPEELLARVRAWAREHGELPLSTAVRLLVASGLGEDIEEAAVREGINEGMARFQEALARAFEETE